MLRALYCDQSDHFVNCLDKIPNVVKSGCLFHDDAWLTHMLICHFHLYGMPFGTLISLGSSPTMKVLARPKILVLLHLLLQNFATGSMDEDNGYIHD